MQLTGKGKFLPCKTGQLRLEEHPQTQYQICTLSGDRTKGHVQLKLQDMPDKETFA